MKSRFIILGLCLFLAACSSETNSNDLDLGETYKVIDPINGVEIGLLQFNQNSGYVLRCSDQYASSEHRGVAMRETRIIGNYEIIGKEIILNDLIVADVKFYNKWGEQIETREELFDVTSPGRKESLPFCRKAVVEGNILYAL